MIDNIGKFWVVTKPTELSVIEDILFETDIKSLFNQVRGGLKEEDIKGLFITKRTAESLANNILKIRDDMNQLCNDISEK